MVIPALYECEDGLNCDGRFHKREHDSIKGFEFTGTTEIWGSEEQLADRNSSMDFCKPVSGIAGNSAGL